MGRGAAQGGSGLRLLAALAAGSMIAGAFAPWGSITAAVMGSGSPVLAVPGIRVGLDAGVIPWGWVVLAAGAIGAVGVLGDAGLAIAAGFVGAVAAVSNLALFGRDGRLFLPKPVADLVQAHPSLAWGSVFALASSLVLLVTAATLRNRLAHESY